jgi:putative heme-binding domain-containing protein
MRVSVTKLRLRVTSNARPSEASLPARLARLHALIFAAAIVSAAGPLLAQRELTAGDIEDGGQLFQANCATCHGPDGDAVPGVDLGHGQFRRASSDDDLVQIIRNGIPATAMPPTAFSDQQAGTIVVYLRSLAISDASASVPGDAARGKALFEGKGQCLSCHRVNGTGSRLGPDLSDIGQLRRAVELERSLLDPGREVRPADRLFRVVTRDGVTTTGRLLNHDTFTVQLLDAREQLRSFVKANLREYNFVGGSSMQSYRSKVTPPELADLVRYLVSLKGVKAITP